VQADGGHAVFVHPAFDGIRRAGITGKVQICERGAQPDAPDAVTRPGVTLDNGGSFRQLIVTATLGRRTGNVSHQPGVRRTVATKSRMGLKRIPPPGFRPSATHGELGPVQVRKFLFTPRAAATGAGGPTKPPPSLRRAPAAVRNTGQTGPRPSK
jgi:hypothetical protein